MTGIIKMRIRNAFSSYRYGNIDALLANKINMLDNYIGKNAYELRYGSNIFIFELYYPMGHVFSKIPIDQAINSRKILTPQNIIPIVIKIRNQFYE